MIDDHQWLGTVIRLQPAGNEQPQRNNRIPLSLQPARRQRKKKKQLDRQCFTHSVSRSRNNQHPSPPDCVIGRARPAPTPTNQTLYFAHETT
jgi:hypothetical protein